MLALLIYLMAVNALTFAVFAEDKRRAAGGGRRIAERILLALAVVGGSVGAITAQQLLRHKTRKQPFAAQLWSIAVGQALAVVLIAL